MSLAAAMAFFKANEALIATVLFFLSEILGASPKIKANGILSFLLIKGQEYLKGKGAVDHTP